MYRNKPVIVSLIASLLLVSMFLALLFYNGHTKYSHNIANADSEAKQSSNHTNPQAATKSHNNQKVDNNINNNIRNKGNGSTTNNIANSIGKSGNTGATNGAGANGNNDRANGITNNITNNITVNINADGNVENNINVNINADGNVKNGVNNNINSNNTVKNGINNSINSNNDVNNSINNSVNSNNNNNNNGNGNGNNNPNKPEKPAMVWGIDSASAATNEQYACVRENFGEPAVWGRYLGDKNGVSKGLTKNEADFIHSQNEKVLLIYNQFTNTAGYENGKNEASQAIKYAQDLGVPEGVALFADIEPDYPVDADFIRGWYETIASSSYKPGIYGAFDSKRKLFSAYNDAAASNREIKKNTIIWSASPSPGVTEQSDVPEFKPEAPQGALTLGWQYGIDSEVCNIDTN
ncbi:glycoside hydrolase domain-containing protein [Bacillus songklensis]|uniref:Glycoside hydrolase domain-containing protein n=1 Tax=Bacillus songklensis TaxID=1069116 RepID=A0ABV8B2Y3_9BACI